MTSLRLWLPGAPRTKKTSNQLVPVGRRCSACHRAPMVVLPSKAWKAWAGAITPRLKWVMGQVIARGGGAGLDGVEVLTGETLPGPIAWPVNCAATFRRDADRGDAVGYYQGLADVLQDGGVVSDDKWIVAWDGSRLAVDHEQPRVELVLTW